MNADLAGMSRYQNGEYASANPTWHEEDSAWKAGHILRLLQQEGLEPATVCEIGCGAGGVLSSLHEQLPSSEVLVGYDVAPQAIELAQRHATSRLRFVQGEFVPASAPYDLALLVDLIEHVENPFELLRDVARNCRYCVLHIPLDMSADMVIRGTPLTRVRSLVGHIHYFTKDLALALLAETGFDVVAHAYTGSMVDRPARSPKTLLARIPRKALFGVAPDFTARVLGGYSLLVLARSRLSR